MPAPQLELLLQRKALTAAQYRVALVFRDDYTASLRIMAHRHYHGGRRNTGHHPGFSGGTERERYHQACQAVRARYGRVGLECLVGLACEEREPDELASSLGDDLYGGDPDGGWVVETARRGLDVLAGFYALGEVEPAA